MRVSVRPKTTADSSACLRRSSSAFRISSTRPTPKTRRSSKHTPPSSACTLQSRLQCAVLTLPVLTSTGRISRRTKRGSSSRRRSTSRSRRRPRRLASPCLAHRSHPPRLHPRFRIDSSWAIPAFTPSYLRLCCLLSLGINRRFSSFNVETVEENREEKRPAASRKGGDANAMLHDGRLYRFTAIVRRVLHVAVCRGERRKVCQQAPYARPLPLQLEAPVVAVRRAHTVARRRLLQVTARSCAMDRRGEIPRAPGVGDGVLEVDELDVRRGGKSWVVAHALDKGRERVDLAHVWERRDISEKPCESRHMTAHPARRPSQARQRRPPFSFALLRPASPTSRRSCAQTT